MLAVLLARRSNCGEVMREQKEQWNHRIKIELADGMREVQSKRGDESTMRELTEEALALFCKVNGVKVKEAA